MGVSAPIPKIKEKGAEFLSNWLPKVTLHSGIDYRVLHKDVERIKAYKKDPLRHDKVSSRLFLGMKEAMKQVSKKASEIHLPILFQLSGDDQLVSTPTAETVFKKIGAQSKRIFIYPDSLHEIYNDLERAEVIQDLKQFLQEHKE